MFIATQQQSDDLHRLEHPISRTAGTIRNLFCPVHRRRADFILRDSGTPTNPDLFCPVDGFRVAYLDLVN